METSDTSPQKTGARFPDGFTFCVGDRVLPDRRGARRPMAASRSIWACIFPHARDGSRGCIPAMWPAITITGLRPTLDLMAGLGAEAYRVLDRLAANYFSTETGRSMGKGLGVLRTGFSRF